MNALDALYAALGVALAPVWARKARGDWPARFGRTPTLSKPNRPRLLLHAVSVGEVNALRTLVPLLTPHLDLVISVGTDTGIERARSLFADSGTIVRYPLDFSRCVARFLGSVRPDAVGLVELELWPNFIRECRRRGVPVAVINGRLSERSFRGYRRIRGLVGAGFSSLEFAAVQDAAYAARFEAMGVDPNRCLITGSMKWDTVDVAGGPMHVAEAESLAEAMGIDRDRPLVVAGSTAEGEEALLHRSMPPGVQLLCAPRQPTRFDKAAMDLPRCVRRSRGERGPADRYLLDTIGELRAAYALADVAVVGRSFGKLFGSDPIEPVALGKPTVIGPSYSDFTTIVEALVAEGAVALTDSESLGGLLADLLGDGERRRRMAACGIECIRRHQGASERHAELLLALLGIPAGRSAMEPAIR